MPAFVRRHSCTTAYVTRSDVGMENQPYVFVLFSTIDIELCYNDDFINDVKSIIHISVIDNSNIIFTKKK